MTWVLLSLTSAVFEALKDLLCKQIFPRTAPPVVAWALVAYSIPFLMPFLCINGIPTVSSSFWPTVLATGVLDAIGVSLYIRAIARSDLSICLPLLMFTPLFMLFLSPLILGEVPGVLGGAGVLLIIGGSYVLNLKASHKGPFEPFRALLSDRGAQMMLIAAAVFSVGSSLHKIGVIASSPLWYFTVHQIILAVLMLPFALRVRGLKGLKPQADQLVYFFGIGMCVAILMMAQLTAYLTGLAVYAIALKRVSVLVGIALGCLFLQEGGFRERMAGASIMMAGAVLTTV